MTNHLPNQMYQHDVVAEILIGLLLALAILPMRPDLKNALSSHILDHPCLILCIATLTLNISLGLGEALNIE